MRENYRENMEEVGLGGWRKWLSGKLRPEAQVKVGCVKACEGPSQKELGSRRKPVHLEDSCKELVVRVTGDRSQMAQTT